MQVEEVIEKTFRAPSPRLCDQVLWDKFYVPSPYEGSIVDMRVDWLHATGDSTIEDYDEYFKEGNVNGGPSSTGSALYRHAHQRVKIVIITLVRVIFRQAVAVEVRLSTEIYYIPER
jgi:hypothetical protein